MFFFLHLDAFIIIHAVKVTNLYVTLQTQCPLLACPAYAKKATTFNGLVFGHPFVKRFALCYRTVVSLSVCLSCPVCL